MEKVKNRWEGQFVVLTGTELQEFAPIPDDVMTTVTPDTMARMFTIAQGVGEVFGYNFHHCPVLPNRHYVFVFKRKEI